MPSFVFRLIINQRGAIALLFGLLLPVVLGFIGVAVDTNRLQQAQSDLHAALETAALAGLESQSAAQRTQTAKNFFETSWIGAGHTIPTDGSLQVSLEQPANSHLLIGHASYLMPTYFMKFMGVSTVVVKTHIEIDLITNAIH